MIIIKTDNEGNVKTFFPYVPENLQYSFWDRGDILYIDSSALNLRFSTYGFIPIAIKGEKLPIEKITAISKKLGITFVILGERVQIIRGGSANGQKENSSQRNRRENQELR